MTSTIHPAVISANEINMMLRRDFPSREGLFNLKISCFEQTDTAAASMINAGIMNKAGGRIFVTERARAFSAPLIWISPQQKPIAKLLYHKTAKGRKNSRPESTAASISAAAVKLENIDEKKMRNDPTDESVIDDIKSEDSCSVLSSDRPVLKKSPEKRPNRNMNIAMAKLFFICMSDVFLIWTSFICSLENMQSGHVL